MNLAEVGGLFGTSLAVGSGAAAFLVNLYKSFMRINGQLDYWKRKAGEHGSSREGNSGGSGQIIGDPIVEMEDRIFTKLNSIEARTGCDFSEVFQGFLKCLHDLRAKEALSTKELIDAIDTNIVQCSQLIVMLETYGVSIPKEDEN